MVKQKVTLRRKTRKKFAFVTQNSHVQVTKAEVSERHFSANKESTIKLT